MCPLTCDIVTSFADCEEDFSGGIFWPSSRRNRVVSRRCSELHSSFRSGVTVNRFCGADGQWLPADLRDCTMFNDSYPIVIVYAIFNRSVTELSEIESITEVVNIDK